MAQNQSPKRGSGYKNKPILEVVESGLTVNIEADLEMLTGKVAP